MGNQMRWRSAASSRSSLLFATRSRIAKACLAWRSWTAMVWSCWARSFLAKGRKRVIRVERKSENARPVVGSYFSLGLKGFVLYRPLSGGDLVVRVAQLQHLCFCYVYCNCKIFEKK